MRRVILSIACIACLAPLSISGLAQTSTPNSNAPNSDAGTRKADPVAWNLLKSTRETRYYFLSSFVGFTTGVVLNDNGKIAKGTLKYDVGKGSELNIERVEEAAKDWLNETVMNILGHRRSPDFDKGDGRHPITFGEDDSSPAGRRVVLNDSMKSSYRIRDNHVTEVDRTVGTDHFTISIMEETPAGGGRFLPRHFTVTYFDAKTGAIKRSEAFTDEYRQVSGIWFPMSRRVVRAENGKVIIRIIEFHNPRIRFDHARSSQ